MNTIRALVVDDERFSREELIYLLGQHASIKIVGEADSGEQAIMKSIQLQPDVLFLDIEMPVMSGMEVAKSVQELKKVPDIVFATAFPDFAVEAFRHKAIDYLLKPYEEEQLSETITRLEKKYVKSPSEDNERPKLYKLAIEGEEEIHYLDPMKITYVYRDGRVTKIVGEKKVYETKWPLKEVEQKLKDYPFFRIHKSYLINVDYIHRLTPWFNGAYQVELQGVEGQLSVSRNYAKNLRNQFEL